MKQILKNVVILTCFFWHLHAEKFRCDYYHSNVGWLKYHEIPATWHDARLRCRYEGSMLASPTSRELREAMQRAIRPDQDEIFTGIHATVSRGSFHTIDGTPLDAIEHRWAKYEPSNFNNEENCIGMNAEGNLSTVRCGIPRPYMCYKLHFANRVNICGTSDPEYRYEGRTGKCYKFHTVRRTYARAHFVCSAEGGNLLVINSEEEAEAIKNLYAQYPDEKMIGNFKKDFAFVGFHDYGEGADFITVDGQTLKEAGYDKFSEGEPNNATTGEYCGSVNRNGLFNDLGCEDYFAFICEKDPGYPAVCSH